MLDSAQEQQPLLLELQHDAQVATDSAPRAPGAGPPLPPESAGAALPSVDNGAAAAQPAVQRLLSERRCRYCLQEEEPGDALEAPCKCAGSIKWAHHACVQRWVDEKRDKRCEICGSQFKGDYRQPAPAPTPLHRSPLVAQLQVTNDDTRIVSLADPVTGEVIARMVVGPAAAELQAQAAAAAAAGLVHFREPAAAAAAGAGSEQDCGEAGPPGCLLLVLYVLAWVVLLVTIPFSMAADAGDDIHLVRLVLICVVLAMRVMVWPALSQQEERQAQQRHAAAQRARRLAADLETGLAPGRPHEER